MRRFGISGPSTVFSFSDFTFFICEDTNGRSSFVGSLRGFQPPGHPVLILSNSAITSSLAHDRKLPKRAQTPFNTGSPLTLWLDLSPDSEANENIATSSISIKTVGKRLETFSVCVAIEDILKDSEHVLLRLYVALRRFDLAEAALSVLPRPGGPIFPSTDLTLG